ncbi:MAG: NAD-dependent epimerase/dehydratase family protein [Planctomycetes bacterium]|nr:NAD-dependent epimerase/dehydratase family protein [Planctomycetota bacterium]
MKKTANAFWNGRRVLVTGATGILGGWLTKALTDAGADPAILQRDHVPHSNFMRLGLDKRVSIVRGELESYRDVERALAEYEIEICFHLGAQAIVPVANRSPMSTFESNIKGSWNVLEAARHTKTLRRLVFASSDKAYGDLPTLPYTEDMPLRGSHPYDCSKSCADLLAQCYAATYRLPVTIVRCGNLYGGGDLNWNRIIPGTIRSILREERPIIRSDGTPLRDYLYVQDAVSAYLACGEKDGAGEAFNFGTETPTSVLDVVKTVLKIMRSDLKPDVRNEASNEIAKQWLSSAKAREKLGWKPAYDLDRGLRETCEWYREFLA